MATKTKTHMKEAKRALNDLLKHFEGNKNKMARELGISRNSVGFWFTKGYCGRVAAIMIDKKKSVPFTKEQLRPDIQDWSKYKS